MKIKDMFLKNRDVTDCVVDCIAENIFTENTNKLKENLNSLDELLRHIYIANWFINELLNGGYLQYIDNYAGRFSEYLLSSAKAIFPNEIVLNIEKALNIIKSNESENLSDKEFKIIENLENELFKSNNEVLSLYSYLQNYIEKEKDKEIASKQFKIKYSNEFKNQEFEKMIKKVENQKNAPSLKKVCLLIFGSTTSFIALYCLMGLIAGLVNFGISSVLGIGVAFLVFFTISVLCFKFGLTKEKVNNLNKNTKTITIDHLKLLKEALNLKINQFDSKNIDTKRANQLDKEIEKIEKHIKLSDLYKTMLLSFANFTGHFNIKVDYIDDEDDATDSIFVYNFKDLLQNQVGFCIDEKLKPYKNMRQNMVAIADLNHDFYCIDCSNENSPVYYAMHGMGDWEFDVVYETLAEFVDALIVYKEQ